MPPRAQTDPPTDTRSIDGPPPDPAGGQKLEVQAQNLYDVGANIGLINPQGINVTEYLT
ncbi:MAG: hypothetical protein LC104_02555 [Bacteroidales bacterium]|nr:hypothetical protein [Bacteroidales bacterium]